MTEKIAEKDLYLPIKELFEQRGYTVQAEVKNCDVMAVKDDEIVIIELKTSFCLKLVYQVMERQAITKNVFIGIPRPTKIKGNSNWKSMLKLLKTLGVGIVTVALDSPIKTAEIIALPYESTKGKGKKMQKTLNEFSKRQFDENVGGTNKTPILTSYKEKCIELLCVLYLKKEPITIKELKEMGFDDKVSSILNKNYYLWFEKVSRGNYTISPNGLNVIKGDEYIQVINFFLKKYKKNGTF